jgi:hypothetical protein
MDLNELLSKARSFLNKNYIKVKKKDCIRRPDSTCVYLPPPGSVYVLHPDSINGMAKFEHKQSDCDHKQCSGYLRYTNKNNKSESRFVPLPLEGLNAWYRTFSAVGNSASSKRFKGGKRTRRNKVKL